MLQALSLEVRGTLADDERVGLRIAFNRALVDARPAWPRDVAPYSELLAVTDGSVPEQCGRADRPFGMLAGAQSVGGAGCRDLHLGRSLHQGAACA